MYTQFSLDEVAIPQLFVHGNRLGRNSPGSDIQR